VERIFAASPQKKENKNKGSRLGAGGGISELFEGGALRPPLAPSRPRTARF